MKVLLVGGGSGGHINPALATAGYLKKREPDVEILYVGAKGAMEERLVPAAGYTLKTISISGFQRKLTPKNVGRNLQTIVRMFTASGEAKRIIAEFSPDVCVGTGGYVSGPVIREAAKMGIPCVIHESNAYPGVTTKMLAKQVRTVMLAVPEAQTHLPAGVNCVVTGNPVRMDILDADYVSARNALGLDDRPFVLSFGGSLGAATINNACAEMLRKSAKEKQFQHLHGYGKFAPSFIEDMVAAGYQPLENPQIRIQEYIDDMPTCLAAADLVICRTGAITLSELKATGKASILIPSPNVAENHQYHNAMEMVKHGAAAMIEDHKLTGELLWNKVTTIASDTEMRKKLGENAAKLNIHDANARIYREIKRATKRASGEESA